MIAAYREGLRAPLADGGFDVVHAQDCISANAALALRDDGRRAPRDAHRPPRRRLPSPSLIACQERSIVAPDRVLCVSRAVDRTGSRRSSA